LRTSLATVKELIRSLKSESRSRKSLQLALHSLRELQAA
jgi:signal transduction histidine kinase